MFDKTKLFRLEEPCDGCAAPYGYHNIMPLTTDVQYFAVSLKKIPRCFIVLFDTLSIRFFANHGQLQDIFSSFAAKTNPN